MRSAAWTRSCSSCCTACSASSATTAPTRSSPASAAEGAYEIISGFRGADTNALLRATRGGGVARHSLHMEGRAIDVRLPGVPLAEVRDAAIALRAGGVGFYARDRFVHLDTGRVRTW